MITPLRLPVSKLAVTLAVLLLWAPLPFGSVTPLTEAVLRVAVFLTLAGAAWAARRGAPARTVLLAVGAIAAVAAFALAQSAPWPRSVARLLSPEHVRIQEQAEELVPEGRSGGLARLSLAPEVSRSAALDWLAFAAALAAAAQLRRSHDRRLLAAALVAGALFQVLYGTQRWVGGISTIWGVDVPGQTGRLRGTFVNPNHFAFQLELALAVVFAVCWWAWRRSRRETAFERRVLLVAVPGALWLALFTALAFSGSRAGLLAALATGVAQGLLIAWTRQRWRTGLTGIAAALAGLALVAVVGYQQGLGRLVGTSVFELTLGQRTQALTLAAGLWWSFPLLGSGIGSFREAFSLVHPPDLGGEVWMHAHSQPVELLVTGGLVGLGLVAAAFVLLVATLVGGLQRAVRTESKAAALAGLGALATALVHESFDFALTIPANALTLAVVLGVAAGMRSEAPSAVPARRPRASPRRPAAAPAPGGAAPGSPPAPGGSSSR